MQVAFRELFFQNYYEIEKPNNSKNYVNTVDVNKDNASHSILKPNNI